MKNRTLTNDEQILWQKTTKDVRKYSGEIATPKSAHGILHKRSGNALMPNRRATLQSCEKISPGYASSKSIASPVGGGDPAQDKRAARRRIPIDRHIDLHGMTSLTAEQTFYRFITNAWTDGCRCILVITGKGGFKTRGVLHQRFSEWVNSSTVKPMIARASSAHQKDGGAGAWYVFLKRKK